jgi:hypothetical protein
MSKLPIDHVSLKIKRKRAPVWPFATKSLSEHVVKLLAEDELARELSTPGRLEDPPFGGSSWLRASNTRGGFGSRRT